MLWLKWLLGAGSLYVFHKGFLLARVSLPNISDVPPLKLKLKHDRIVIMLLDAMRFDFVSPSARLYSSRLQPPSMSSMSQLANTGQAQLLHFVADAPTTTLQRLQALLTGTLPTFIDAASNFNGEQLQEDSWVRQAHAYGKLMAFMGDETWFQLLPSEYFTNDSRAFGSFDVTDLDTVDRGIESLLWPLMANHTNKWNVLIGHFLGLDHAGHTYGPEHSEFNRKMSDLDVTVARMIREIDQRAHEHGENVLLMVFGDHGMDGKGDHGGDSLAEVDAGLFVYSPIKDIFAEKSDAERMLAERGVSYFEDDFIRDSEYAAMSQVDLVPTLSVLLGTPIPFGNLGTLNLPLLSQLTDGLAEEQILALAQQNADQLKAYLTAYHVKTRGGLDGVYRGYVKQLHYIEEELDDGWDKIAALVKLTRGTLQDLKHVWARFDMLLIYCGLTGLALTLIIQLLIMCRLSMIEVAAHVAYFAFVAFMWLMNSLLADKVKRLEIDKLSTLAVVCMVLHSFIYASNSLVVHEDVVVLYLLQSILLLMTVIHKNARYQLVAAMVIVRMVSLSTVCREEQAPHCIPTFQNPLFHAAFADSTSASVGLGNVGLLYLMAIFATLATQFTGRHLISSQATFILTLLSATYWTVEALMERDSNMKLTWLKLSIARGAIAFSLAMFIYCVGLITRERQLSRNTAFCMLVVMYGFLLQMQLPSGSFAMSLCMLAILALFKWTQAQSPTILSKLSTPMTAMFTLLGHLLFFSTGHQATFSSIQFQTGFIGVETFDFYQSGALVTLNSIGPWLYALVASLVWHSIYAPHTDSTSTMMLITTGDVLMSSAFTAMLRRHLMVWKIFAPRAMLGAVDYLVRGVSVAMVAALSQLLK